MRGTGPTFRHHKGGQTKMRNCMMCGGKFAAKVEYEKDYHTGKPRARFIQHRCPQCQVAVQNNAELENGGDYPPVPPHGTATEIRRIIGPHGDTGIARYWIHER